MGDYNYQQNNNNNGRPIKFCQYCGNQMDINAAVCPVCGGQAPQANSNQYGQQPYAQQQYVQQPYVQPPVVVNNNMYYGRPKDKWVAFLLCFFLGAIGIHKFYEGKTGMGILYIFTAGLFGIGWLVDLIIILTKPNPYYV